MGVSKTIKIPTYTAYKLKDTAVQSANTRVKYLPKSDKYEENNKPKIKDKEGG